MIMFAPLLFLADPHAASAMQVGPNPSQRQESTLPIPHRRTIIETAPSAEAGGPERKPATTDRLADCLGRAQRDSAAGIAFARGWLAEGATPEARVRANQCLGLIQSDLGDFGNAERSFTDALQGIPEAQKVAGVPLLAMAGNAALAGGAAARALDWFDKALAVTDYPDTVARGGISIDRARALVTLARFGEARSALDLATRLAPANAEGWLLSATLARREKDLARAQKDVETAAGLDPRDPAIGLEAGVVAVLSGHDDAARKSWASVVQIAPNSAEAKTAQGYLEQLGAPPTSAPQPPR
ncbi:tetratricopeptide repeat protein [Novosphingobium sp.]|uniref:tetratricopeptide repeat protein n=1 Tax=Novosphingobium sp. TaxID=1874826 RepID=UPI0038BAD622